MKPVLIIQNITREAPGVIAELLRELNMPYKVVDLDKGDSLPSLKNYGGLIVLGGPDSANDQNEKMTKEVAYVQDALKSGMPYLGICLGLQVMIKAGGGKVVRNSVKEIGFRDPEGKLFEVNISPKLFRDPLFQGLEKKSLHLLHLHGETVELNDDMQLLATGKFCKNQIVKIGERAYGIQGHFELNEELFQTWLNEDPDLQALDREQLIGDFTQLKKDFNYEKTQRVVFSNFLRMVGQSSQQKQSAPIGESSKK